MLLGFAGKDLRERLSKEPRSLTIWALFFSQNFEYRYTFYMILWAYYMKR